MLLWGAYGRLKGMDKKEKAAAGIRKDSPVRLEKKSEITGVSQGTLIDWSKNPEMIPDELGELLTAIDESWPEAEC